MGILGYPNSDDRNTGNYSADLSGYQDNGIQNVDLTDAFPEADSLSFEEQAAAAANIPRSEQSGQNVAQQAPYAGHNVDQAPVSGKSSGGGVLGYLFVLLLLVAGVAAYVFINKPFGEMGSNPPEQSTGDYFYDQAVNSGADTLQQNDASAQQGSVATVDVVLETPVQGNDADAPADKPKEEKVAVKTEDVKELTALEKAMEKKKLDEARSSQLGLSKNSGEVVIPVATGGRPDPFLPAGTATNLLATPKFDIVAPPLFVPAEDPMIDKLMTLKLSGIMYDEVRPSAILEVGGNEQLVHNGDILMGYTIKKITKDKVVVGYKNNTYEVTAGQTLNASNVNVNPVSSLSKQFGGAYSSTAGNAIEIN